MNLIFLSLLTFILLFANGYGTTLLSSLSSTRPIQILSPFQSVNMELFQINSSSLVGAEYVMFEVTIEVQDMANIILYDTIHPMVCYEFDTNPSITLSTSGKLAKPCKNGYDFNQYYRSNGLYSIRVDVKSVSFTTLMFGVYMESTGIIYSLRARVKYTSNTSSGDICPFDCGQNSSTQTNCVNKQCVCPSGLIDIDCSQQATEIVKEESLLQISTGQMTYAYYKASNNPDQLLDEVTISLKVLNNASIIDVYLAEQGDEITKIVPSPQIYYQKYKLYQGGYVLKLNQTQLYNKQEQPKYVVFGITQSNSNIPNQIIFKVTSENKDMSKAMMIFIFVGSGVGLLVIIFIILTIIKIRNQDKTRVNNLISNPQNIQQGTLSNIMRRLSIGGSKLTENDINEFMPSMPFSQLQILHKKVYNNQDYNELSCAVCLIEFKSTDNCREAICGHPFHKECLDSWLAKQETCPFCRTNLSKQALKKQLMKEFQTQDVKWNKYDNNHLQVVQANHKSDTGDIFDQNTDDYGGVSQIGASQVLIAGQNASTIPNNASHQNLQNQNTSIQMATNPQSNKRIYRPLQSQIKMNQIKYQKKVVTQQDYESDKLNNHESMKDTKQNEDESKPASEQRISCPFNNNANFIQSVPLSTFSQMNKTANKQVPQSLVTEAEDIE